ncbi:hypothetical protein I317_01678 [Kwoniella heveanensis CBS 569]|nr:hypothetical protein I317_01678 [Kwoniella heveanensis CBS 569]
MSVPLTIAPTDPILSDPSVVILDASWLYEPDPPTRDAYEEFNAGPRFPGARFWSLDEVSEPHPDGYALMLPSPERFAKFAGDHGIERDSHVIVYDNEGVFAAPRTAWTFKVYGHEKVSVIDGGLPRARKEGVKLETGPPKAFGKTTYPVPTPTPSAVVEFPEITKIASRATPLDDQVVLIDARPASAYEAGHIPTSLSFDFPTALLTGQAKHDNGGASAKVQEFTYLREKDDLRKHLTEQIGEEAYKKIESGEATVVNTCGGGLSAAINWLQLQSLGIPSRLYDESWGGYSARPETVRVTGPHPL